MANQSIIPREPTSSAAGGDRKRVYKPISKDAEPLIEQRRKQKPRERAGTMRALDCQSCDALTPGEQFRYHADLPLRELLIRLFGDAQNQPFSAAMEGPRFGTFPLASGWDGFF